MRVLRVVALLCFALLELTLFAAATAKLLPIDLPSYSIANITPFWMDIDRNFGVWHPANRQYRHLKSCFDVTYRSNAEGMRDSEIDKQQPHQVVVLGDSFIEGFGVEAADRLTEKLEARTGIRHLNFGTSGNFGLTQSWLLYKTLASTFAHDAVIISVLPDNDFSDDDFGRAKKSFSGRYRPYLVGSYPAYTVRYTNPNRVTSAITDAWRYVEIGFSEFSYTAKAYAYFDQYRRMKKAGEARSAKAVDENRPASKFYDFTPEEFARLRYAIERIAALAAPRPVLVMTIPRRSDYRRAAAEGGRTPLSNQLDDLSKTAQRQDLDELFHDCDPHWSAKGHEMAATKLSGWAYYKPPVPQAQPPATVPDMPVGALPSPGPAPNSH